jgi:hypothetical protein
MIGLIVVLLFFVVHTVLGAIGKKPQGTTASGSKPSANVAAVPPAPVNPDKRSGDGGEAFPTGKATASVSDIAKDPELSLDIADPFEPAGGGSKAKTAHSDTTPAVSVVQSGGRDPLTDKGHIPPTLFPFGQSPNVDYTKLAPGSAGARSGATGGSATASVETVLPPPPPEIRLIGVVEGTPSVATLSIGGRVRIVRPGDPLVRGWRLMSITSDEVTIRHDGEYILLRVGGALNEAPGRA